MGAEAKAKELGIDFTDDAEKYIRKKYIRVVKLRHCVDKQKNVELQT